MRNLRAENISDAKTRSNKKEPRRTKSSRGRGDCLGEMSPLRFPVHDVLARRLVVTCLRLPPLHDNPPRSRNYISTQIINSTDALLFNKGSNANALL